MSSPQSSPVLRPGDDVIVRLCLGVTSLNAEGRPRVQLMTHIHERIPVPLRDLRTIEDVRKCLRSLLPATMEHAGLSADQVTRCAAILSARYHPQNNGFLVGTANDSVWSGYTDTIASIYHYPCLFPEDCDKCLYPAFVVAYFPATARTRELGKVIWLRDEHNEQHGESLYSLSQIESVRYSRMIERREPMDPPLTNGDVSTNQGQTQTTPSAFISVDVQNAVPDPTKGPKGRSLLGATTINVRLPDYSKGTIRPTSVLQGSKSESDMCLTCVRYGRKCPGTAMTRVESSRNGVMWKCEKCLDSRRRCLWRQDMYSITTYEEAFVADGGTTLTKNTAEGRRARAERRMSAIANLDRADDGDVENEEYDN